MSRFSATKNSLLQDNSWIRKTDDEDEDVDRDPNFGKIVLSQYRSTENLVGSEPEEVPTTKPIRTSTTSVQALSKRFSGSQDELRSSPLPSSKPMSSYTKSTYSSLKSDSPKTTTTTTVTKDGTTITSTKSLRSPVITSPTTTFTERVKSSSKGAQYSTYSPTRTTKVTETTVTSSKDPEDKLYDSLIPPSIKDDFSPTDSKTTVSSTETVTVKSSPDGDSIKTTTTTRTSSTAEDNLYDTLLPKSITSSPVRGESPTLSSPSSTRRTTSYSSYTDDIPSTRTTSYTISTKPSEDYSSDLKTYSYSRPDSSYEYSSITSPSVYTSPSYRSNSRSDDILADPIYSKSSTKSVYASPERAVLEKDLCTYCHKPFNADAKMVLDDLKINCHASCFKCAVCNSTLGHMKAGDSMWIYKRMVHCENCFEVTREKWRR
ncbi:sciellin isoform X8 [Dicentrarchus labrax]|uniref:sciellin isoform X8 n=1 Tax=Dicentrarchus labrax TaxID=13489 RepID=UPI0021F59066|nr:sciellin isoform X8 [Dicentrarchus labrax]